MWERTLTMGHVSRYHAQATVLELGILKCALVIMAGVGLFRGVSPEMFMNPRVLLYHARSFLLVQVGDSYVFATAAGMVRWPGMCQ